MTWVDLLIVLIGIASALFGIWRGFAKEALSLATWLAAIWLAWQFTWLIEPMLGEWQAAPELKIWAARIIIFVLVLIAGGLVAWFVRELILHTGLSGTDRALGGLFGLARGALIVGLVAMVVQMLGVEGDPWWQEARLRPFCNQIAEGIRYYAELGSQYLAEHELV